MEAHPPRQSSNNNVGSSSSTSSSSSSRGIRRLRRRHRPRPLRRSDSDSESLPPSSSIERHSYFMERVCDHWSCETNVCYLADQGLQPSGQYAIMLVETEDYKALTGCSSSSPFPATMTAVVTTERGEGAAPVPVPVPVLIQLLPPEQAPPKSPLVGHNQARTTPLTTITTTRTPTTQQQQRRTSSSASLPLVAVSSSSGGRRGSSTSSLIPIPPEPTPTALLSPLRLATSQRQVVVPDALMMNMDLSDSDDGSDPSENNGDDAVADKATTTGPNSKLEEDESGHGGRDEAPNLNPIQHQEGDVDADAEEDEDYPVYTEEELLQGGKEQHHASRWSTRSSMCDKTYGVSHKTVLDSMGNTGIYSGTLDRNTDLPHGRGRMNYQDGSTYEGQWLFGDWSGFGRLTCSSTAGSGTTSSSNSSTEYYEGGWFDNMKHGCGVLHYADGKIFDGSFKFDKFDKGTLKFPDSSTFWGNVTEDGVPHGRGKFTFTNGSVYDGEFNMGIISGHGRMTWPDGRWYLGEWSDGEKDGLGMEVKPDGSLLFEGIFHRGIPVESSSFPQAKHSDASVLLYRASNVICAKTLVGPMPQQIYMNRRNHNNKHHQQPASQLQQQQQQQQYNHPLPSTTTARTAAAVASLPRELRNSS
jgi:hypothetical protein